MSSVLFIENKEGEKDKNVAMPYWHRLIGVAR